MQSFNLPRSRDRTRLIARITAFLTGLSAEREWSLEIKQVQRRRSTAQNAYLWGACYPAIMKHLEGWEAADVHEYCLEGCFGFEKLEGLVATRTRPLKRSKALTVTEFMDYVAWIQRHMAAMGIYVPDPNEECEHEQVAA